MVQDGDSRKFILQSPDAGKRVVVMADEILKDTPAPDMREQTIRDQLLNLPAEGAPCYLFTCSDGFMYFFGRFTVPFRFVPSVSFKRHPASERPVACQVNGLSLYIVNGLRLGK